MLRSLSLAALVATVGLGISMTATASDQSPVVSAGELPRFTPLAHVETRGTGSVHIILIPGVGFDWKVFESFMDRNKDLYTMHAVTLPGFGGSEPPAVPEGSTWEDDAWLANAEKAIVALVDDKKLDKPLVAGHSLGGHIAIRLAVHHPEKFRGALSIDGYPALAMDDPDKPAISHEDRLQIIKDYIEPQFGKTDLGEMQAKLMPSMVTDGARASEFAKIADSVPTPTLVRYTLEGAASDTTSELKQLKIPLVILSAIPDDAVVPDPEVFVGMRNRNIGLVKGAANTTLVFFENTRHFITEDAPKELDAAFAAFIAGKEVPGKPRT